MGAPRFGLQGAGTPHLTHIEAWYAVIAEQTSGALHEDLTRSREAAVGYPWPRGRQTRRRPKPDSTHTSSEEANQSSAAQRDNHGAVQATGQQTGTHGALMLLGLDPPSEEALCKPVVPFKLLKLDPVC